MAVSVYGSQPNVNQTKVSQPPKSWQPQQESIEMIEALMKAVLMVVLLLPIIYGLLKYGI